MRAAAMVRTNSKGSEAVDRPSAFRDGHQVVDRHRFRRLGQVGELDQHRRPVAARFAHADDAAEQTLSPASRTWSRCRGDRRACGW